MDILAFMSKAKEGEAVARMGSHFEMPPEKLQQILGYVVPMLEDAMNRLMAHPQGLATILAQMASGQYQRDVLAGDLFDNSRIHANGTGLLSLLLRNEATIRVISSIAAEGAKIDATIIRRMMPFIACIYISALARRSQEPLRKLAERYTKSSPKGPQGAYQLAELVLSKSPMQKAPPHQHYNRGSIKDILNTLSRVEFEEERRANYIARG